MSQPNLYISENIFSCFLISVTGLLIFSLSWILADNVKIPHIRFFHTPLTMRFVTVMKYASLLKLVFIFSLAINKYGLSTILFDRTSAFRGDGILLFSINSLLVIYGSCALELFRRQNNFRSLFFSAMIILIISAGSRSLVVLLLLYILIVIYVRSNIFARIKIFIYAVLLSIGIGIGLPVLRQPVDDFEIPIWLLYRIVANTFQEGEFFNIAFSNLYGIKDYTHVFFEFIYVFLPRSVFPNKPVIWGKATYEVDLGLKNPHTLEGTSYAFGQLTELFIPFGLGGLIIGMTIWGFVFNLVERINNRSPGGNCGNIVYYLVFFGLFWILRHGYLGIIQYCTLALLWLVLLLLLSSLISATMKVRYD